MSESRVVVRVVVVLVGLVLAWRVVATGTADHYTVSDPERAHVWDVRLPSANLALAYQQLDVGAVEAAAATARRLLALEPLSGSAFAVLAEASIVAGRPDERLIALGLRRAPRDLRLRSALVRRYLAEARYAEALEQIDASLRLAPIQEATLLPAMVQAADAPDFSEPLAKLLVMRPVWGDPFLATLLSQGSPAAVRSVYAYLDDRGKLSADENSRWLEWLKRQGNWDEAYARWVAALPEASRRSLPLLYDGRFQAGLTGNGFDWTAANSPGVQIEPVANESPGSGGVHLSFSGRRVSYVALQQPLLLAPGRYVLALKARAQNLRSDKGIEWVINCVGMNEPLAETERFAETFDWRRSQMSFQVPAEQCPAQMLLLHNPGAQAAGKEVAGELWFDEMSIALQVAGAARAGR